MPRHHSQRILVLLFLGLALLLPQAASAGGRPLLVEGKKTLFQRVLVRPHARLRAEPGGAPAGPELRPFDIFYVYDRKDVGGSPWLQLGRAVDGQVQGWLEGDKAIDWRQTIVVSFANPGVTGRALLFDTKEHLLDLVESEARVPRVRELRAQATAGQLPEDSNVVSIQPDTYIDITRQFYLLPILNAERVRLRATRRQAQLLKIACVPLGTDPLSHGPSREEVMAQFKLGVVFVLDTTLSMDSYIERTQKAVQRFYEKVRNSPIGAHASFGVVAFRDDPRPTPAIEYRTKTFLKLEPGQQPDAVLRVLSQIKAARVSDVGFTEDSVAGLLEAIRGQEWDKFDGRMIVLVTDAGPLEPDEPQASSPLEMPQVRQEAQVKNIFIYPVHLLSEAGVADHDEAEQNYRQLGHFGSDDLYQPVADGSVSAFGAVVDHLAESVLRTVDNMVNQRLNDPGPAGTSGAEAADRVGLAMQLAFLGQRLGTRAPDVFEAWLLDKELEKLDRSALEVRLMITKNQLSTLRDVVTALVQGFDGHRDAQLDSAVLFQQLRSAVALMTRDPDRVVDAQFHTLGDAMGEYLADLPYTSEVMGLTEQDWAAAGGARQREIIDGLKSKLELYKRYHDSPQIWTDLYQGAPPGEAVFAMPLDALP